MSRYIPLVRLSNLTRVGRYAAARNRDNSGTRQVQETEHASQVPYFMALARRGSIDAERAGNGPPTSLNLL